MLLNLEYFFNTLHASIIYGREGWIVKKSHQSGEAGGGGNYPLYTLYPDANVLKINEQAEPLRIFEDFGYFIGQDKMN